LIDPALPEITTAAPLLHHSTGHDPNVTRLLRHRWFERRVGFALERASKRSRLAADEAAAKARINAARD